MNLFLQDILVYFIPPFHGLPKMRDDNQRVALGQDTKAFQAFAYSTIEMRITLN